MDRFLTRLDLTFTARYHYQKKVSKIQQERFVVCSFCCVQGLLQDFAPFDPNQSQSESINPRDVKKLENRLFSNLREMLSKANFTMVTGAEVDESMKHAYRNTVPVEPDWLQLEPMFHEYMGRHKGGLFFSSLFSSFFFFCLSSLPPQEQSLQRNYRHFLQDYGFSNAV